MNHASHNVTIYWLGQMGLMIKSGNTTLCIDYFASPDSERQTQPPIPAKELTGVDAFLGTHDHLDHIDHEAWKIWAGNNPDAKFLFPRKHMEAVLSDGIAGENAIGLNAGESVTVGDATIHAVAASHEFLDKDPESGLYPYLQYIVEINGVRIHHAGDTVRYEGMLPAIKAFGDFDVELLPINGRDARRYLDNCIGNMTYQEAVDFAGEVGPKLVIPGHWDMFAHNSADPKEFEDYLYAKYGDRIKCRIPKVMEGIEL
jgi:L-ascorbate metabolism protein UlaG (beta-lactamase superfamily)